VKKCMMKAIKILPTLTFLKQSSKPWLRNTKTKGQISNVKIKKNQNLSLKKDILMDMRAMEFPDGTFDCVIDKATLDSVLVKKIVAKKIKVFEKSVEKVLLLMFKKCYRKSIEL